MTSAESPHAPARPAAGPFLVLCLTGFAGFFCSYLRIPVLPLYAASLGAGPPQVGLVNGAFMLAAALLSIPAGLVADRVGRRIPVVCGLAVLAVTSFLLSRCGAVWQLAVVYLTFGAGLAAFAPAMLSLVADTVPPDRLGRAYGWYTTAVYLAMALGPAAGGYLARHLGLAPVFRVAGGLLVLVALGAALVLPRGGVRRGATGHGVPGAILQLLRLRQLSACLLVTLGCCVGFGAFLSFLPLHAAARGLDSAQTGLVFAVQALTNVASRIPVGLVADRTDRRLLVAAGQLCFAAGLTALGLCGGLPGLLACALVLGLGMALTFTAVGALVAEAVAPVQRGLAMGMYNSCIYLGMMAGSAALGPVIRAAGYPAAFGAGGAVALAALLAFVALARPDRAGAAPP